MAAIEIFKNESFGEVRVAGTSEQPLFCLADICRVLEIKNVSDCKSRLDQRGVVLTDTPTRNQYGAEIIQQLVFINEKNLYKVIMRSDKPQAEPFQDWVCGEVLPSIRKTDRTTALVAFRTHPEARTDERGEREEDEGAFGQSAKARIRNRRNQATDDNRPPQVNDSGLCVKEQHQAGREAVRGDGA